MDSSSDRTLLRIRLNQPLSGLAIPETTPFIHAAVNAALFLVFSAFRFNRTTHTIPRNLENIPAKQQKGASHPAPEATHPLMG
jgi:hypothetical protein